MPLRGRSVWVCAGAAVAGAAIAKTLAEAGARVLLQSAPGRRLETGAAMPINFAQDMPRQAHHEREGGRGRKRSAHPARVEGRAERLVARDAGQAVVAEQAIEALVRSGGAVEVVAGDLHSREQIERVVDNVWRAAGPLYGLVVQPAGAPPRRFEDLDQAAWQAALDTWLRTPFFLAQSVAPRMASAGGGRIVHVVATGRPASASIADRVTRRGLLTMTTGLAKAVGPLVQLSAVVESDVAGGGARPPGALAISQNALGERVPPPKSVSAEQLTEAVRFLLDDASGSGGAVIFHLDPRSAR